MKKIPTLYRRDPENMKRVLPEVHTDCQWVLDGEGVATAKIDGTCTKLDDAGRWWARREVKKDKTPPPNFVAVEHDPVTGKTVGWEPMEQSPFVKQHKEALGDQGRRMIPDTYELVGPKINGNPLGYIGHKLERHGWILLPGVPRGFGELRDYLLGWKADAEQNLDRNYEGIVWWREPGNPDSDRAKIKVRDFA